MKTGVDGGGAKGLHTAADTFVLCSLVSFLFSALGGCWSRAFLAETIVHGQRTGITAVLSKAGR